MADRTPIEWTDATWNPLGGCTRVSEGCRNCYAEIMAARFSDPGQWGHGLARRVKLPDGRTDHRWTGEVRLIEDRLDQPMRWRRQRRIFVNSTSDLFHERVPDEWIDRVFAVMALTPQHTYQILTKRPERMREYLTYSARWAAVLPTELLARGTEAARRDYWPLPNVWLGTSAEDQATADARIPHLLATPAAVRFLSAEPLLGPVDLTRLGPATPGGWITNALRGTRWPDLDESGAITSHTTRLDWIIVGGESGPGARPMHPSWARSLRDQCVAAGVAYFHKQNGMWLHESAAEADRFDWEDAYLRGLLHAWPDGSASIRLRKHDAGRLLDGREWSQMPGAV